MTIFLVKVEKGNFIWYYCSSILILLIKESGFRI